MTPGIRTRENLPCPVVTTMSCFWSLNLSALSATKYSFVSLCSDPRCLLLRLFRTVDLERSPAFGTAFRYSFSVIIPPRRLKDRDWLVETYKR